MAHPAQVLPPVDARYSVVVLTHNRVDELLGSLDRMRRFASGPRVIVVDNGSCDGTPAALARAFPEVVVIRAGANLGAAGRNLGLRHARTPYVALADDDTWWTPHALARAADLLDAHPRLAVVSGRVLVGPDARVDPVCRMMAASPLARDPGLPGPRLLGFLAGASMVRRDAVLAMGGFEPRLFLGSEETLLAADLAAAGWSALYAGDVVVHHQPSTNRDAGARRRLTLRNDVWFAWRRRSLRAALAATATLAWRALRDPEARAALSAATAGVRWAAATRQPLPASVEAEFRRLERWLADQRRRQSASGAKASPCPARPAVASPRSWER
jgi:GT2 family glycosyltransferase